LKLNLTVEEAAKYSGIGEKNIRNLLKEKACPFLFMVGNKHSTLLRDMSLRNL
jgi:excisionase family DNA binding protein